MTIRIVKGACGNCCDPPRLGEVLAERIQRLIESLPTYGAHRPPGTAPVGRVPGTINQRVQKLAMSLAVAWLISGQQIASRSDGYSRYSHTNSKRSMFHSLARAGDFRRSTTSCWRRNEILGLKPCSSRQPRPNSEQQLDQKSDHRLLLYHTPTSASSRIWFSGGTMVKKSVVSNGVNGLKPRDRSRLGSGNCGGIPRSIRTPKTNGVISREA
jgi:hypothetical protein